MNITLPLSALIRRKPCDGAHILKCLLCEASVWDDIGAVVHHEQDCPLAGKKPVDLFKNACRIHTHFMLARYLMSCSYHRLDGAEKAQRHNELCRFYVAAYAGMPSDDLGPRSDDWMSSYRAVHSATQRVTDHLDGQIGFPLDSVPNYEKLLPLFFEKFHEAAVGALE